MAGGDKRVLPGSMQRFVARMNRRVSHGLSKVAVQILVPQSGATVNDIGQVEGTAALPPDSFLWVLARRKDFNGCWPRGTGAVSVDQNRWRVSVTYGGPQDKGADYELAALVVRQSTHALWSDWVTRVRETGLFPPVQLPLADLVLGEAFRTVIKAS